MTRRTSLPTETVPPAGLDGLVIGLYISGVPAFSQKQTDSPLQVDSSGQAMSCRCVVGGGVGCEEKLRERPRFSPLRANES